MICEGKRKKKKEAFTLKMRVKNLQTIRKATGKGKGQRNFHIH